MTIRFSPGESILGSDVQTLICPVNCTGVMGSGLALQFSKTYKGLLYQYRKACERGDISIKDGVPSFWVHKVYGDKHQILCFPVEVDYNDTPEREYIVRGIKTLVREYQLYGIESLGVPMIGCDSGTFNWADIGQAVVHELRRLKIPVTVYGYDPVDPPKE